MPLPWVAISRPLHVGFAIRGSGDGGLARRAIMAATTIVVLAIVTTTMTAVAVLIVVLVSMVTIATVATAGWVRQCGGWWPGCQGRSVGVERRWG
jgi:hypothetical protein